MSSSEGAKRMERDKLERGTIDTQLAALGTWFLEAEESKWIVRKYRFATFLQAIAFVNEVAQLSEALNHHPMIAIDYKMVTLRLTSWSAGGLTELDFRTAAKFDQAYAQLTR
ncbi:4a-hydroxytetrahydrobiopterin dehydratase [Paenibacillus qinlingensis]|uniref:4a-hydroxytetrahydrobiopterin dehydratase n=1 Tax=Paenibacillus qinlingensis TaxID=1837343 RepID=A0ABU1P3T1_9BACL|nr:4a-hydroxytetrahydrobiopterin dehydratase [Paenibacillus qinlingensis]MDR6554409.1 4a-hydroxytetrahydrobiopterin dehydratase [Paenibacillus qinlingensis]